MAKEYVRLNRVLYKKYRRDQRRLYKIKELFYNGEYKSIRAILKHLKTPKD